MLTRFELKQSQNYLNAGSILRIPPQLDITNCGFKLPIPPNVRVLFWAIP